MGYLEHPTISNCFSLPLAQINPGYLELITSRRNTGQHQSGSAVKAPPDKMYWKLTKCIGVFMVTRAKSNWLDLLLRMQKATSCPYLLILGVKLLLHKFDANLAISNPRYLELFFDTLESLSRTSTWSQINCDGCFMQNESFRVRECWVQDIHVISLARAVHSRPRANFSRCATTKAGNSIFNFVLLSLTNEKLWRTDIRERSGW